MSEVDQPDQLVLAGDSGHRGEDGTWAFALVQLSLNVGGWSPWPRHGYFVNTVWLDGHTAPTPRTKLLSSTSYWYPWL